MHRLLGLMAALVFVLGLGASVAVAAEPYQQTDQVLVAVNGTADLAADPHHGTLVLIGGDTTVRGDAHSIVVVGGTATLAAATTEELTVIDGHVALTAGASVTGPVRTLDGTIDQAPGSTLAEPVQALEGDIAALGILLAPAFILLFFGFGLVAIVAGLVMAAFGARQVRELEGVIRREPGQALVAGIVGTVLVPIVSILMMVTIVGLPLGLAILLLVVPVVAFAGWLVAAIWVGDWIVTQLRGAPEPGRPYLAAIVGVIALSIAGIVPFVSAIATLFGVGALLLTGWRTFRGDASPVGDVPVMQSAPGAA